MNVKILICLLLEAFFLFSSTNSLRFTFLDDARTALMSYSKAKTPTASKYTSSSKGSVFGISRSRTSTRRRSSSRRRRRSSTPLFAHGVHSVTVSHAGHPRPAPKPKKQGPHNKFLQAVDEIEKAVFEAEGNRLRSTRGKLVKLRGYIQKAVKKRSYKFARQALGYGIYSSMKLKSTRFGKRGDKSRSAKSFTDLVKSGMTSAEFEKFLSVKGEVTLAFAIDDTGSMADEIDAAKSIATSIVNHPRREPVDFVLSPFNDPGTGPLIHKEEHQKSEFVKDIAKLRAHAGGDCPELTFTGMLAALDYVREGSPLYVFTDASAKDAKGNKDYLLELAKDMGVTVNFFTTGLCGKSSFKPFETLACETCGSMFRLRSSSELRKLTSLTRTSLGGSACLTPCSKYVGAGRKRSAFSEYAIQVDNTMEELTITVTTANSGPTITLYKPGGPVIRSPQKTVMTRGAVYTIKNPTSGRWRLLVSRNAGKHTHVVKATSNTNIDFDHVFVLMRRGKAPVPISSPLIGQKARVIIMLARAEAVSKSSLRLVLVDKTDRRLKTVRLTPKGTSGAHFYATFRPPSVPFRFLVTGATKRGYPFKRYSRGSITAKPVLLRVTYAQDFFTVPANPRRRARAVLTLHNSGPTERFLIKVKDRLGCTIRHRRIVKVRRGRNRKFVVSIRARASFRGRTDQVFVTATGKRSGISTTIVMTMFVV